MKLRVGIAHTKRNPMSKRLYAAIEEGVRAFGDVPLHIEGRWESRRVHECDCVVQINDASPKHATTWTGESGLRNVLMRRCWRAKIRRLVLETGFLQNVQAYDRGECGSDLCHWALGWDGIKGAADYAIPTDADGARFDALGLQRPPERGGDPDGPVLIFGQVEGGYAEIGFDAAAEYGRVGEAIRRRLPGRRVLFRLHPAFVKRRNRSDPEIAVVQHSMDAEILFADQPLRTLLDRCSLAVCWASNVCADVVLAGVPLIVLSDLSIGAAAAERDLENVNCPRAPPLADRIRWLEELAWRQWTLPEIASGKAWKVLRTLARESPKPPYEAFR